MMRWLTQNPNQSVLILFYKQDLFNSAVVASRYTQHWTVILSVVFVSSVLSLMVWIFKCFMNSVNVMLFAASATDISQRFILVNGSMNWTGAQTYCRKRYTDLARVRNQLENEQLQGNVINSATWIGLDKMSWMWSDGSETSFVPWKPLQPLHTELSDCSAFDIRNRFNGMISVNCDNKVPLDRKSVV